MTLTLPLPLPLPLSTPIVSSHVSRASPAASTDTANLPRDSEKIHRSMASGFIQACKDEHEQFFTGSKDFTLGKAIMYMPKLISIGLHSLGNSIQGGHDFSSHKGHYLAGVGFKAIANVVDFCIELTRSAIDHTVLACKGLFQSSTAQYAEYIPDLTHDVNVKLHNQAMVRCADAAPLGRLLVVTCSTSQGVNVKDAKGQTGLPEGFKAASIDDIPPAIMARREGTSFSGTRLKLHQESSLKRGKTQDLMVLKSDAWSSLRVGVFKKDGKVILCFKGSTLTKLGTLRANANILVGVRDRAINDANILVKAFVETYGNENVELVGHSLGANIAADAGIRNNVRVTTFNAYGLSLMQRLDLGSKIVGTQSNPESATVTNFNSSKDLLTKRGQQFIPTRQVGVKVRVEGSAGHSASSVVKDVQVTASQAKPPESSK